MEAFILSLITWLISVIFILAGFHFCLPPRNMEHRFKRFLKGLFILLTGGFLLYVSYDCYEGKTYINLRNGKKRYTGSFYGLQISEDVYHSKLSKAYRSCNESENEPRWVVWNIFSGLPDFFEYVVHGAAYSSYLGDIWNSGIIIVDSFEYDHFSPVPKDKKCVIMKMFFYLANREDLYKATKLTDCFEKKLLNMTYDKKHFPNEEKIKKISRECQEKN